MKTYHGLKIILHIKRIMYKILRMIRQTCAKKSPFEWTKVGLWENKIGPSGDKYGGFSLWRWNFTIYVVI